MFFGQLKLTARMKVRFSLWDVYLACICLFPISTIIFDESFVNKLIFGCLLALQIFIFFLYPVKKSTLWALALLATSYVFSLSCTKFPLYNINLLIYFPFCLMYCYFMNDHHGSVIDWFYRNTYFVNAIVILWSGIVGISIFLPSCYHVREGGSLYFGSFCGSIFRLGPSAVFIQTLVILEQILYRKKYAIIYMVIPMYCFFMGSSRTYFVVGFCLFIISWFVFCRRRIVFWSTAIWLLLGLLLLVGTSALGDKIAHTLDDTQYGDFWFRITSSRSVIWSENMQAWNEANTINKLFGSGFGFSYRTTGHWAHNDFIEILCSSGIFGLLLYICSVCDLISKGCDKVHMPIYIKLCVFMTWFFNAFFNMFYVYFCAMLCYPFLLQVMKIYFSQVNIEGKCERVSS